MNIFNASLTGSTQVLGPIFDSAGNTGSLLSAIVYDPASGQTLWAPAKDVIQGIKDVAISISQSYSASAVVGDGNIIQILQHSGQVDTLEILTGSFVKSVNAQTPNAAGNVTLTSGNGLTTRADGGFNVGAGNGITVNADDVALATTTAGNGLTYTAGVLAVGAGNGITVNADDVALATTTAGNGLTYTNGVLAVGAGNGITVNADDVALATTVAGGGLTYTNGVLAVGAGTGVTVNADDIALDLGNIDHDSLQNFVANEHIDHSTVSVIAGSGLTGGGTIAADRTLNIGAGNGITVNADDIAVKESEVDHDALSNFVANEHIDHTTVSVLAGNGMTGGGTIAADRTITLGTPSTLTAATTDAVTATSHTHAITTTTTGTASTIVATNASGQITAANFITTSDRRLKADIKEIEKGLEIVKSFLPYSYVKNGLKESGWIAQDVAGVIPHAVQENEEGFLTMSDRAVVAHLHKAILELSERLDKIEGKLQ